MSQNYIVLDRDGVINVDLFDYVLENETFEFEEGSIDAIATLTKHNFKIIIATNQTCINLGLISSQGIEEINNYWIDEVKKNNNLASINKFHFLDGPVTGGVEGAKNKSLSSMVGGKLAQFKKEKT